MDSLASTALYHSLLLVFKKTIWVYIIVLLGNSVYIRYICVIIMSLILMIMLVGVLNDIMMLDICLNNIIMSCER